MCHNQHQMHVRKVCSRDAVLGHEQPTARDKQGVHLCCLQAVRRQRGAAHQVVARQPAHGGRAQNDDACRAAGIQQLYLRRLLLEGVADQFRLAVPGQNGYR